ncbi:hypothetical protein CAP31_13680 [Sulfuriferula sp. AH1]|uniref:RcnB family protein n=1 Tax=Sulfuriferula sp. AH1 TaxID=1985873 RepID=UPI000B3B3D80|nr:RcnB family protein [Sulfuriferula sp. AH1]ARU32630.1 hypothetical protein CAP31_13680 [Sulfuriferula sp. AH1]
MQRIKFDTLLVLAFTTLVAGTPAFADKPSWAGGGQDEQHGQSGKKQNRDHGQGRDGGSYYQDSRHDDHRGRYFDDRSRIYIHDYYAEQYRSGRCPPGLAKKHNGCMPPGQARKWQIGRPLPRDVVYYDLPPSVIVNLGPPPSGHRYIRVAGDILLIAIGTGMVVDAIDDLNR